MVGDKDMDEIIEYVCLHDKKLILVGDNCQIPAPSQQLVKSGTVCFKPDSTAFDIVNQCRLTNIVRQAEGSTIIRLATYLRDHLLEELDLQDILTATGVSEGELCATYEEGYAGFLEDWKQGLDTRILAYTNAAVRSHNKRIRDDLGFSAKGPLVVDELLTGYDNIGWPVPVVENGTDYKVLAVQPTAKHCIDGYTGLVGNLVDLIDLVDPTNISRKLFFINVEHKQNATFMKEFARRAEKVNQRYSTKDAYKKYCRLKNRAVFLEDVYKHGPNVYSETDFRQTHPLLFTQVSEVINTTTRGRSLFRAYSETGGSVR